LVFTLFQRRMLIGLWLGGQVLLGLAIAYLALARGLAAVPTDAHAPDDADLSGRLYGGEP
jgi:hypothetical protein